MLLQTNDIHSNLEGHPAVLDYTPATSGDDDTLGGLSRLAAQVAAARTAAGSTPVMLLDSGDFLMGTPFEIETRDRILFLEDVGEEPYRIDEMLTQLRLAGKLDQAAGIIFGECHDCAPREFKPAYESTFSLGEVLDRILGSLRIPVLSGLTLGHTDDQVTLPIGVMASLDAGKQELVIEESAVAPT